MKTNFHSQSWLKKLALAVGCTTVFGILSVSAFAQGNPGQPQFGGQSQFGPPQSGDPSQFGGDQPQFGGPQQFGPQQQFNRPQQTGQPGQFGGQNPAGRQGQFGPSQQSNRQPQFRGQAPQQLGGRQQLGGQQQMGGQRQLGGQQQMGGQGQQFAGPNSFRGQNGSMQGRGSMPRTVGGSQHSQSGQFNRPQGMPGGNQMNGNAMNANQMNPNQMRGNQMGGNPGMNRNAFAQNGNMQGMNRGQSPNGNPGFMGSGGPNAGFNPQANPQGGRNFMNPNQGQQFQGQQFQGPQNQGPQFQGPQFQGPQNPGQQFQNQQFQNPQSQAQFGQSMAQNGPSSPSCQFCPEGTCPAGDCQNGTCKNCPNGICSAKKPAFGQPQGNVQIGGGFNGVMATESDDSDNSAPIDLVLKNVELVFAGNPATHQGPVYRVSVLNKSDVAVEDAFEVALIATNGNDPDQTSPAAGERIESIAPGQVAVVEIQLPVEVNQMSKTEAGEPQPFTTLIVVVDARQEIEEVDKSNNATKLPRTAVRSAQPAQVSGNF